jgi:hypothetical protein
MVKKAVLIFVFLGLLSPVFAAEEVQFEEELPVQIVDESGSAVTRLEPTPLELSLPVIGAVLLTPIQNPPGFEGAIKALSKDLVVGPVKLGTGKIRLAGGKLGLITDAEFAGVKAKAGILEIGKLKKVGTKLQSSSLVLGVEFRYSACGK